MTYEYRYSIEDYHGHEYEDSTYVVLDYYYDLRDEDERQWLAKKCAEDHRSDGGYEDHNWMQGEYSLKFWIWVDKDTKFCYDVWCEMTPEFYVRKEH